MALTGKAHECCDKKTTPKATECLTSFKNAVVPDTLFSLAYLYEKQELQLLNVELAGSIGKEREARDMWLRNLQPSSSLSPASSSRRKWKETLLWKEAGRCACVSVCLGAAWPCCSPPGLLGTLSVPWPGLVSALMSVSFPLPWARVCPALGSSCFPCPGLESPPAWAPHVSPGLGSNLPCPELLMSPLAWAHVCPALGSSIPPWPGLLESPLPWAQLQKYSRPAQGNSQKFPHVCLKRWIRQQKWQNHQTCPGSGELPFPFFFFFFFCKTTPQTSSSFPILPCWTAVPEQQSLKLEESKGQKSGHGLC